ncbi:hypothetical protein D6D13_00170 [Aureobasidium pullulans]|uniref:Uncharacterized protein n=1 Tax=Aureobasidium pullulans TaxID=5580 RepID=A0A4S9DD84_AURPU|nr:hypothetical protein D6D13_00170 [Aureobasidium pullulans]
MSDLLSANATKRLAYVHNRYGVQKWGFVVYRCTYDDDEAWAQLMEHIKTRTIDSIKSDGIETGMIDRLDLPVIEDPTLEAASKTEVRCRFRKWVLENAQLERASDSDEDLLDSLLAMTPRYNFCIHVDAGSLLGCIVRRDPPILANPATITGDRSKEGYVNLIRADSGWSWDEYDPAIFDREAEGYEEDEEPLSENEVEVEGCKLHDVGWMKISPDGLMPAFYGYAIESSHWDVAYVRSSDGVAFE